MFVIMNKFVIFLLGFIICLVSCNSYDKNTDRWEGITDDRLQIHLSEFFPLDEKTSKDTIADIIKQRMDARASLILASYISINLARNKISGNNDMILNELIDNTVKKGVLINYLCSENNHCNALGVYNVMELLKRLKIMNNQ